MQKLRRNTKNLLEDTPSSSEKEDHNVNLEKRHWDFLDRRAEEENISRNEALRRILESLTRGVSSGR